LQLLLLLTEVLEARRERRALRILSADDVLAREVFLVRKDRRVVIALLLPVNRVFDQRVVIVGVALAVEIVGSCAL
jgi:hypothetical protein